MHSDFSATILVPEQGQMFWLRLPEASMEAFLTAAHAVHPPRIRQIRWKQLTRATAERKAGEHTVLAITV
jgi:hypothetical protein